ncbi:hypothetical protein KEJ21_02055 [Candidatus Bathyarchaeota archaeon]|nr:hypothetical protein [Candidatus Bathyarchaeota archaeon]MBS7630543.1 hypothetical protein [Candidatus Bathyarchaeota archaeon]
MEIKINYPDKASAESILKAISPDNRSAPPGIEIKSEVSKNAVKLSISCVKGLGSLISTIDDLLSCIQIAEKALKGIIN